MHAFICERAKSRPYGSFKLNSSPNLLDMFVLIIMCRHFTLLVTSKEIYTTSYISYISTQKDSQWYKYHDQRISNLIQPSQFKHCQRQVFIVKKHSIKTIKCYFFSHTILSQQMLYITWQERIDWPKKVVRWTFIDAHNLPYEDYKLYLRFWGSYPHCEQNSF